MEHDFRVQDESGDKKYFTIIPNYILNHSTLWDREVYIQMKRIAGESGTCWTSRETLAQKCGMSLGKFKSSIKYLLDHHWIELIGKRKILTNGGIQEVNEYKICDLWNINNTFYEDKKTETKGGSPEIPPIPKGGSQTTQRGVTDDPKGGSWYDHKEEPYTKKNPILRRTNTYGEFKNVFLAPEEHEKLTATLGEKNTDVLVQELSAYMASKGKRYQNHYATLVNWARRKVRTHNEKVEMQTKKRTIASINS